MIYSIESTDIRETGPIYTPIVTSLLLYYQIITQPLCHSNVSAYTSTIVTYL